MNCSKCNALIPDDAAFCPECGAPVESPAVEEPVSRSFCPNCGAELQGDAAFCGNCGERLTSPAAPKTKAGSAPKKARTGKKFPIKKVLLLVVVLVMATAVVLLAPSLFRGGSDSYVVYMKNAQLQFGELPKLEEVQEITTKLNNSKGMDDPEDLQEFIRITEDGKKLFYPERVECDEHGWVETVTLYYRYINNPKKDAVKIDSGVSYYEITKNGTMVYYLKNGNLYQHDMKEKSKIDSNVIGFLMSENGNTLLYAISIEEDDGSETFNVYLAHNGEEPEKILSGVSELEYSSPDLSMLVYEKNESLYVKYGDEDPVKIASDVVSVIKVHETGEIYYTKQDQEEFTHWDFIEDDVPDTYYSEYYSEQLANYTVSNPMKTLYYYNGTESTMVAENVIDWEYTDSKRAVLVYECYDGEELPKMTLSEYVEDSPSMYWWLRDEMEKNAVSCVAIGGTTEEIDVGTLYTAHLNDEGMILYVCADYDEEDACLSLYKLILGENSVESFDLMDDEVYTRLCFNNDSILYFKEVNDGLGELYMDGNYIDDDVAASFPVTVQDGRVYYMQDYNYDKDIGTFTYYDGKETVAVKDDVSKFFSTKSGDVLFLYDYNVNHHKGELWILDGKKVSKLDEEVAYVVWVN